MKKKRKFEILISFKDENKDFEIEVPKTLKVEGRDKIESLINGLSILLEKTNTKKVKVVLEGLMFMLTRHLISEEESLVQVDGKIISFFSKRTTSFTSPDKLCRQTLIHGRICVCVVTKFSAKENEGHSIRG
eukprot:GHVP01041791.1.p1 GENE.GHVP01041791.1~~GHVP01041791.1.p1  ORF type:complete len:132 (-),score=27.08 GHVP01041791.1:179-574(-)